MLLYGKKVKQWIFQKLLYSMISKLVDAVNWMIAWTYMNIKGQGHSLTLVQGHSDLTFSNFFYLETARLIEAKFYVEPPWYGGTKSWSNSLGHITKMAAMRIYGKHLKKSSSLETKRLMTMKVGMQHWVLEYYKIFSNDNPGMKFTYFMAMSNLVPYAFVWEKGKTMDFFRNYCILWY